jgi:hypothetical protein
MKSSTALKPPLKSHFTFEPELPREFYDDSLVAMVFTPRAELWIGTFDNGTIKKGMDGVVTGGRKVNGHRETDSETVFREWREETDRRAATLRLIDPAAVTVFGVYEREIKGNWKHEAKIHYLMARPEDAPRPRDTREMSRFRKLPMDGLLATLEHMRGREFKTYRPRRQPKGMPNFTESFLRALDRFEREKRLPGQDNFNGWKARTWPGER